MSGIGRKKPTRKAWSQSERVLELLDQLSKPAAPPKLEQQGAAAHGGAMNTGNHWPGPIHK